MKIPGVQIFSSNLLEEKVCIISGGRTGIGLQIANAFLHYGATVIVFGRKKDLLMKKFSEYAEFGTRLFVYECDITKVEKVKCVVKEIVQKFSKVDTLINNAALNFEIPAEQLMPNILELSVKTNFIGHFLLSIQVAKVMMKQSGDKRIINISAYNGGRAYPGLSHMHACKAALNALTKTLAIEWSRFNILVNAISPGPILTPNFIRAHTRLKRLQNMKDEAVIQDYRNNELPLKRYIEEKDIANMAIYLSSPASRNITGEIISVDGGESINNSYLFNSLVGLGEDVIGDSGLG